MTSAFIHDAVTADEPILVVVDARKIAALRRAVGVAGERVQFADMAEIGRNPARIIPAWRSFVDQHSATRRRLRGVGEPIWPGRSPVEMVECRQHEALLNMAFGDVEGFWLMCPYDTSGLDRTVIEQAHGTHPYLRQNGRGLPSERYDSKATTRVLHEPLPAPTPTAIAYDFGSDLAAIRRLAARHGATLGLAPSTVADLVLVVGELITNTLRHGGGTGSLQLWHERGTVICEVQDRGQLTDPLVGRRRPTPRQRGRRGLWVVNQICDLVQVRSTSAGTTVRAHLALD